MPRTAVGGGKRVPLSMKTTREIRDMMDQAAKASGRSLAQEVERRLEQSCRPSLAEEYAGSRYAVKLIEVVVVACRVAEGMTRNSVDEDPETFRLAIQIAHRTFGALEPKPEAFASTQARADIEAGAKLTAATMTEPDREAVKRQMAALFTEHETRAVGAPPVDSGA